MRARAPVTLSLRVMLPLALRLRVTPYVTPRGYGLAPRQALRRNSHGKFGGQSTDRCRLSSALCFSPILILINLLPLAYRPLGPSRASCDVELWHSQLPYDTDVELLSIVHHPRLSGSGKKWRLFCVQGPKDAALSLRGFATPSVRPGDASSWRGRAVSGA